MCRVKREKVEELSFEEPQYLMVGGKINYEKKWRSGKSGDIEGKLRECPVIQPMGENDSRWENDCQMILGE